MAARRSSEDQVLAGALETLRYIVNLEFPGATFLSKNGEVRSSGLPASGPILEKFLSRVRLHTRVYWPELWAEDREKPPESMLRRMRNLLRRFWEASDDPRARDWYIHRAREFYQEPRVLRASSLEREMVGRAETKDDALNLIATRVAPKEIDTLDQLPPHTPFEDALFELQRRAEFPSTRPRRCPNCISPKGPYFLSAVKGQKFCSPECFQESQRKSKRTSWHSHEWRKK